MSNNNKTNYRKMSETVAPNNNAQDLRPIINERPARGKRVETNPVDEVMIVDTKKELTGKVVANLLNVRVAPIMSSDIVTQIKKDSKVSIDLKASTDEWYAITTEDRDRGFCMKKFIAIC